jgi:hypothetical protein
MFHEWNEMKWNEANDRIVQPSENVDDFGMICILWQSNKICNWYSKTIWKLIFCPKTTFVYSRILRAWLTVTDMDRIERSERESTHCPHAFLRIMSIE